MIELNEWEVDFIRDILDHYIFDMIREDDDIDGMLWLYNAMQLYKKVGGLEQFDDYDED